MRVLLAIDGSVSSDRARDLVAGIRWPEGTMIRAVAVLEHATELAGVPWMAPVVVDESGIEASLVHRYQEALDAAGRALAGPGRGVETMILRGRPASILLDEARSFGADLLVLGNRGHGQLETILLGSVSTEVVDHAPCPVLVARASSLAHILLADDGSPGSAAAAELLTSWPIFAGLRVTVTSASEVAIPWSAGMAPGLYDQVLESYTESVQEARREVAALVSTTADRLSDAGLVTDVDVRDGDPAACIVKAATEHAADLVVCGTRGHTGLTRLLLGSVARKVLVHAPCSVLIVRAGTEAGAESAAASGSVARD